MGARGVRLTLNQMATVSTISPRCLPEGVMLSAVKPVIG